MILSMKNIGFHHEYRCSSLNLRCSKGVALWVLQIKQDIGRSPKDPKRILSIVRIDTGTLQKTVCIYIYIYICVCIHIYIMYNACMYVQCSFIYYTYIYIYSIDMENAPLVMRTSFYLGNIGQPWLFPSDPTQLF